MTGMHIDPPFTRFCASTLKYCAILKGGMRGYTHSSYRWLVPSWSASAESWTYDFHINFDYAKPAWLYDLIGPVGESQMCGHLVSICSGISSLPEPSSMPEAVFLIVCNSPLQMSWPYSKTPGAWFLILSLGLAIKSTPHLFFCYWSFKHPRICRIATSQAVLQLFVDNSLCYRCHSKLVEF